MNAGAVGEFYQIGNRWMSRRLSRLARCELPDSQCGFRLVRLEAWKQADLHTTGFEIESEMLIAFIAAGFSVAFVPIEVIYKQRPSKIHPVVDSWRWWRWWRSARTTPSQPHPGIPGAENLLATRTGKNG